MRVSIENDNMLSEHLSAAEVRAVSPAGWHDIDAALPQIFEIVRKYSGGKPLKLTDAGRNPGDVKNSAENSAHFRGNALDIKMSKAALRQLKANLAEFMKEATGKGLYGFGVYPGHVHVDTEFENVKYYYTVPGVGYDYALRHWSEGGPLWLIKSGNIEEIPTEGEYAVKVERSPTVQASFNPFVVIVVLFLLVYIVYNRFIK